MLLIFLFLLVSSSKFLADTSPLTIAKLICAEQAKRENVTAFSLMRKTGLCKTFGDPKYFRQDANCKQFQKVFDSDDWDSSGGKLPLFAVRSRNGIGAKQLYREMQKNKTIINDWNDDWVMKSFPWYKSPLLRLWDGLLIKTAIFSIFQNNTEVVKLEFKADTSTKESWFSKDNLIHSTPWSHSEMMNLPFADFSIEGGPKFGKGDRSFLIQVDKRTCDTETGFLAVHDAPDLCQYVTGQMDVMLQPPIIRFAKVFENGIPPIMDSDFDVADELRITAYFETMEHFEIYEAFEISD